VRAAQVPIRRGQWELDELFGFDEGDCGDGRAHFGSGAESRRGAPEWTQRMTVATCDRRAAKAIAPAEMRARILRRDFGMFHFIRYLQGPVAERVVTTQAGRFFTDDSQGRETGRAPRPCGWKLRMYWRWTS